MRQFIYVLAGTVLVTSWLLLACTKSTLPPPVTSPPTGTATPQSTPGTSPTGNLTAPTAETVAHDTTRTPSPLPVLTPTPQSEPLYGWAFEGEIRRGAADATVVTLPDGSYRMYFGSFNDYSRDQPGSPYIGSAVSRDGLLWTDEGDRGLVGGWPRVIHLPDGRYRMYYGAGGTIAAAASADGLKWDKETLTGLELAPTSHASGLDVVALADGTFRMYYSLDIPSERYTATGVSNIISATSKDSLSWQQEAGVRVDYSSQPDDPLVQHPRVIKLSDGTYRMFYWIANQTIWSAFSRDGIIWDKHQPERILGADPDIVSLPDGRLRMYVNLLSSTMFGSGKDAQRMWSYVWGIQPYTISVPDMVRVRSGQSAVSQIEIKGTTGTKVSLEVLAYASEPVTDPPTISLDRSSGTVPFSVKLTVSGAKMTTRGIRSILIRGTDGKTQTQFAIPLRVLP